MRFNHSLPCPTYESIVSNRIRAKLQAAWRANRAAGMNVQFYSESGLVEFSFSSRGRFEDLCRELVESGRPFATSKES